MPVFPNRVPNLQNVGPIIEVVIFPPQPVFNKLRQEGKTPPDKKLIALIDTGASRSCIDDPIANELGLIARDVVRVQTPSGNQGRHCPHRHHHQEHGCRVCQHPA
jgi:hypothetical protein